MPLPQQVHQHFQQLLSKNNRKYQIPNKTYHLLNIKTGTIATVIVISSLIFLLIFSTVHSIPLSSSSSLDSKMIDHTASSSKTTSPTIIIIRHGEKLDWIEGLPPSDVKAANQSYIDNHLLSSKGTERAHALVGYFTSRSEIIDIFANAPLAAIVAQGVDVTMGKSERPRDTIKPLYNAIQSGSLKNNALSALGFVQESNNSSTAFSDSIKYMEFKKGNVYKMVEFLKNDVSLSGKSVIVSWSHQQIPAVTVALGVDPILVPPKWGKRFDLTWVLEPQFDNSAMQYKYILRQMAQRLLYGDEDDVVPVGEGFVKDVESLLKTTKDGED